MITAERIDDAYENTGFQHKYWISYLSAFFLVAFAQMPSLFFINNIGDCGYFLTNQELANQLGLQHIKVVPWWWFSDILGGWWLKIAENYGLWGAKLGSVILMAITSVVTLKTLFQLYKPSIGIVCAVAFAGMCMPCEMINYISVPTFLYSVFCLFFLRMHTEPTNIIHPILCGLSFVFLVFSRMPMIIAIILPIICILLCKRTSSSNFSPFLKANLRMLGIAFSLFLLFSILLYSQDLLSSYLLFQPHSKDHTYISLLTNLTKQSFKTIPFTLSSIAFGFTLYYLMTKRKLAGKSSVFFLGFVFLLTITAIFIYCQIPSAKPYLKLIIVENFDLFLILTSVLITLSLSLKKSTSFPEHVLMILGIAWPLLRSIGSVAGFNWMMNGFLLCGIAYVLFQRAATTYNCKLPLFLLGSIFVLILGGKSLRGSYCLHRDYTSQISSSQIPRMEGIYANPKYAENIGSLIHEMEKHVHKNDRILACPYIPIIYYVSQTLPLGNHSCLFFLDFDQFERKLDEISYMPPPRLIVMPKIDFEHPQTQEINFRWPTNPEFLDHLYRKIAIFDQKIIKNWNAKAIWSNEYFDILIPNIYQNESRSSQSWIK